MTITVSHATQAAGTDEGNGEIRKAQWNEGHVLNMATARLVGRTGAGVGGAQEISVSGELVLAGGVLGINSVAWSKVNARPTTLGGYGITDAATSAQGSLAASATQPGDDADTLGSGAATDGQVLTADGEGGAAWEAVPGGGAAWVTKTTTYTAVADENVIADTSGGAWTLTLPASPSSGDVILVADGDDWATNNLTIARNGATIVGVAQDLVCEIGGVTVRLVYDGTTWQVYISATSAGLAQDGADGAPGADGVGVPIGGTTGQALVKASATDQDVEWGDLAVTEYACKTFLTADATINNSTSFTQKDVFNTSASINNGGFTVAAAGITVPETGVYLCSVNAVQNSLVTRANCVVRFSINGTGQPEEGRSGYIRQGSQEEASVTVTTLYSLTAGDQLRLEFKQEAIAGTVNLETGSHVMIYRVA